MTVEISVGFTPRQLEAVAKAVTFALRNDDDCELEPMRMVVAKVQQAQRRLQLAGFDPDLETKFERVCEHIAATERGRAMS